MPIVPPSPPLDTTFAYRYNFTYTALMGSFVDPRDGVVWSASPANATLGANNVDDVVLCDSTRLLAGEPCINGGNGHAINPRTGEPYAANNVLRGDYARVLAEFWADGPDSETPPGHWLTLLHYVLDHPDFEPRWQGLGRRIAFDDFELRAMLALCGAMHDSAIAAWGIKRRFDYVRPISAIRHLCVRGLLPGEFFRSC